MYVKNNVWLCGNVSEYVSRTGMHTPLSIRDILGPLQILSTDNATLGISPWKILQEPGPPIRHLGLETWFELNTNLIDKSFTKQINPQKNYHPHTEEWGSLTAQRHYGGVMGQTGRISKEYVTSVSSQQLQRTEEKG